MNNNLVSKYRTEIMGLATLWIYLFHIIPTLHENNDIIRILYNFINYQGFCGVDIFLFLSGFGLGYSLIKKTINNTRDYWGFLKKRINRIMTIYVPLTIVVAIIEGWNVGETILKVLCIWQLKYDLTSWLWYVPVILIFYLVTPFYFKLFHKTANKTFFTVFVIVTWIVLWVIFNQIIQIRNDIWGGIIARFPVFVFGFYFQWLIEKKNKDQLRKIEYIFIWMLFIGIILGFLRFRNVIDIERVIPQMQCFINFLIVPGFVVLSAECFILLNIIACGKYFSKAICLAGTLSLEVYVCQEWIFKKISVSINYNILIMQGVCFVLVCVVSIILHENRILINKMINKVGSDRTL